MIEKFAYTRSLDTRGLHRDITVGNGVKTVASVQSAQQLLCAVDEYALLGEQIAVGISGQLCADVQF